jgi:predicted nucleic acid-binding protein
LFSGRILPFDAEAARAYATLRARARAAGQAIAAEDGYIAAIAMTKRLLIATRDVAPFSAVGLRVINPWSSMVR